MKIQVRDAKTLGIVHEVEVGDRDPYVVYEDLGAHLNWQYYYLTIEEDVEDDGT